MKRNGIIVLLALAVSSGFAQRPERSSENTPKLAELLEKQPQLDLNHDGVLTMEEALKSRDRKNRKKPAYPVVPTDADVSYGDHASMKLDFWKADSEEPAPLFVWIHGGGFRGGDKTGTNPILLKSFLDAGVSVASINYRLSGIAPYPAQMHDSARAIQFMRSKAAAWNIDATRIAAGGGSAGSGISQWLAFHDDLANPKGSDPVERFSSRICCALALSMQSTYDPRIIKDIIPGDAFDDSALRPFYGLPNDWDWNTAKVDADLDALIKDASPINHLTADDAPVFIFHSERTRTPGNIHHPNFGTYLEAAMKKHGIECVCRTDADYDSRTAPYDDMVKFVLKQFGMK